MEDLEKELYKDMIKLYKEAEKECSYKPARFLYMLNSGAKPSEVIKRLIFLGGGTYDFEVFKKNKRLDLSIEAVVLKDKYIKLFTKSERDWCKSKLLKNGYKI